MKKLILFLILSLNIFFVQSQNNKYKKNYVCIDKDGKILFKTVLKNAYRYKNGLTKVNKYTIVGNKAYVDAGYMDEKGNIVIPCVYTRASNFKSGVAFVKKRGSEKYHMIDKQGKRLGNLEFDQMPFVFGDLIKVRVNGKVGYANLKGAWQIPPTYSDASPFYDDLTFAGKEGKWAIIDKTGKTLTGFIYPGPLSFQHGYARVRINGRWGIMDKNLKMLIPAQYENIEQYGDGLFAYKQYGKWGYLDETGKVVIKAQYEDVDTFKGGIGIITQNGKKGAVNTKGQIILQAKYDDIWTHDAKYHKILAAFVGDKVTYFNTSGNTFTKVNTDFLRGSQDGNGLIAYRDTDTRKWGYLNNQGEIVIKAQYCKMAAFSEGKALVQVCD